jgi:hypothetical protein
LRKPTVINKYNLTLKDIKNLKILDRSKIKSPLFWRNDVVKAWCISGDTARTADDSRYGTYSDYWIGIYDEDCNIKRKLKVSLSSHGGMCGYNFNTFFDSRTIENEHGLRVQEMLLESVNKLIDEGILGIQTQPNK